MPEKDIWSWTGYTWEEMMLETPDKLELLSLIDILVDGRYDKKQTQPHVAVPWVFQPAGLLMFKIIERRKGCHLGTSSMMARKVLSKSSGMIFCRIFQNRVFHPVFDSLHKYTRDFACFRKRLLSSVHNGQKSDN